VAAKHPRLRINDQIRAKSLRVIDSDGTSKGVMRLGDALALADERELDLVEVAPNSDPPVAKILDYGKELFEASRSERKSKSDPAHEVKELQIKPTTGVSDLAIKAKAAVKFLTKGNRVRVVVVLRGRLQQRPEMGEDALANFMELLDVPFVREHHSVNGSRISILLRPGSGA
jgi:translation initiation factor IF-3